MVYSRGGETTWARGGETVMAWVRARWALRITLEQVCNK